MKCHEAQTALGADPRNCDAAVHAHVESCVACSEHRAQMLRMDDLIRRALTIPVGGSATVIPTPVKPRFGRWQIAASFVASVAVVGSVWVASTQETLAEQLIEHADHEAFAIVRTDHRVDSPIVNAVLSEAGIRLKDQAEVSYAASCDFGRHTVPHLVVQTSDGPVTVLILAHEESIENPQEIHEDGYDGVIVPAPRGVVAVLGKDVPVKDAAEKVLTAVEYL
jgi:hypothetical protein